MLVRRTAWNDRAERHYYAAWVSAAPKWAREIKRGVLDTDLQRVGHAMERSTLAFHMPLRVTSDPSIMYWTPATLAVLNEIRALREKGVGVWATMDAGPHVKALLHATRCAESGARVACCFRRASSVDRATRSWC
ncbi:MAG: hypothetical protein R3A47_07750 [Polyangiales bacterium]